MPKFEIRFRQMPYSLFECWLLDYWAKMEVKALDSMDYMEVVALTIVPDPKAPETYLYSLFINGIFYDYPYGPSARRWCEAEQFGILLGLTRKEDWTYTSQRYFNLILSDQGYVYIRICNDGIIENHPKDPLLKTWFRDQTVKKWPRAMRWAVDQHMQSLGE